MRRHGSDDGKSRRDDKGLGRGVPKLQTDLEEVGRVEDPTMC